MPILLRRAIARHAHGASPTTIGGRCGLQLLALGLAASAAAVPLHFPGQVTVPTLSPVSSVLAVDLDGDGREELIAGRTDGSLAILKGEAGRYRIVAEQTVGGAVHALGRLPSAAGGAVRLVALAKNPDRVFVLAAQEDLAGFTVLGAIDLDEDPGGLALGLSGPEGEEAFGVTLPGMDRWVLIGAAAGVWTAMQTLDSGDRPMSIAAIDLDGDGAPEAVTADNGLLSEGLSIFGREADGRYALRAQISTPGAPTALFAAAPPGAGPTELYVVYADAPLLSIYLPAAGGLAHQATLVSPLPGSGLYLGEFPGGEQGLWTWSGERGAVNYFRRTAGQWAFVETFFTGGRAVDGTLADLNQDQFPDLVVANGETSRLSLLFGNNLRSFRAYLAAPLASLPVAALLQDEDGDGSLDGLVACAGARRIEILRNDGRGRLTADPASIALPAAPYAMAAVPSGAGAPDDLAVSLPAANRVAYLRRQAGGGYLDLGGFPTGLSPTALAAGDLDGDGAVDLVSANSGSRDLSAAFGDGSGGFPDVRTLSLWNDVESLALADLSADGLPEILVTDGRSVLMTLRNLGDRTFAQPMFYALSGQPGPLAAGDFDGDGDPDVVVALRGVNALAFYQNLGNGFLAARVAAHPLGSRPLSLVAANIDLAGHSDVIVGFPDADEVAIVLNLGGWNFTAPIRFAAALTPVALAAGDMNRDAIPDLLAIDQSLALALSMLNVEPNPVPVAPPALAAKCEKGVVTLRCLPPADGAWTLEAAGPAGWRLLADGAGARHGRLERAADALVLRLAAPELGAAGAQPDGQGNWLFKLAWARGQEPDGLPAGEVVALLPAHACAGGAPPGAPALEIFPPCPNPFNPVMRIAFRLARPARVRATVHDLAGRRVALLADGWFEAGDTWLAWDGSGRRGPAGAGSYIVRCEAEGRAVSRKVVLAK